MYTGDFNAAQRPALHVFYVLDTSESMIGNPISVLNQAMRSTVRELRQIAAHNSNANVKIAVLGFNSTYYWLNPAGPESVDFFQWDDLNAQGMTYVGMALDELGSKLHRSSFLSSTMGSFLPVIIFMTDGYASDNYEPALARIRKNDWFSKATRIGFAIGTNPDVSMIAKLTGDSDAVIRTDDLGLFATMLKFVSTSSVSIMSRSFTSDAEVTGAAAVGLAARQANVDPASYGAGLRYKEGPAFPQGGGGPFSPRGGNTVLAQPDKYDASWQG